MKFQEKINVAGQLVLEESLACSELVLQENAAVQAAAGAVVLFVNGVQTQLQPGTYTGRVILAVSNATNVDVEDHNRMVHHTMPAAVSIVDGKYRQEDSFPDAVISGSVQDGSCSGVTVVSRGDNFGGIYVGGSGSYEISDAVFDLVGNGANDGFGYGAAIAARDEAKVTVNRTRIHNVGSIRTALVASGHSEVEVNDSVLYCKDGNRKNYVKAMSKAPWMLGISGRVRATNAQDYAKVTYNRCEITAENWGALSTDGTKDVHLQLHDCRVRTESSGYGTYVMGASCSTTFDHCALDVADYGAICCSGGTCVIENGSTVVSRKNGVMSHRGDAKITVSDSSVVSRRESFFFKDAGGSLTLRNATLASDIGVLVRSIKDDDPNGRVAVLGPETVMDVPPGGFPEDQAASGGPGAGGPGGPGAGGPGGPGAGGPGGPGAGGPGGGSAFGPLQVTVIDSELQGDLLHASTAYNDLTVTLENSTLTGAVSSCTASHINGLPDTPEQYREIGVVESVSCPNDDPYGVSVILQGTSVWTVTETCWLRRLVIGENAAVEGAQLLISGKKVPLQPGEYTGKITLKV